MRRERFLQWLLLGLAAMTVNALQAIQIIGSDLLDNEIKQVLIEELAARGIDAEMSLQGSLMAISALDAGEADACILATPDGSEPVPYSRIFPVAFQVVTFAVNENNPLAELDYQQLADLYQENGNMENWVELLQGAEWQDRKINLWAVQSHNLIALQIFNSVVLEGSPLKSAIRYDAVDSEEMLRALDNDIAALVLLPHTKIGQKARFVALKEDPSGQSYTPSADNVFFGDYPLRLPFRLVITDSIPVETMHSILQAVYSERVTTALEQAHYMPVPLLERQAVLNQFK